MKKKKVNPNDLSIDLTYESESINNNSGENTSEQQGTGTLCISVNYCAQTEINCDPAQTQGFICERLTEEANCQATVDYCVSWQCGEPSENVCLVTQPPACIVPAITVGINGCSPENCSDADSTV